MRKQKEKEKEKENNAKSTRLDNRLLYACNKLK